MSASIMSKVQRNTLSLREKNEILDLILNDKKRRKDIATQYQISESTLSKIVKNANYIRKQKCMCKNMEKKRDRKSKYANLNNAVSKWFEEMRASNCHTTGQIILDKAQELATQLNITDFKANSGWLQRWKKNENITFKRHHAEAASKQAETVQLFTDNVLTDLIRRFERDDIYNADETRLSYVATDKNLNDFKTAEDRITVVLICNASGSKKYLYSIGKYKESQYFEQKIPVRYKFNKSASLTSTLWSDIMKEIDEQLERKSLFLIRSDPCHELTFKPKNLEIVYLPAEMSTFQPLEQGIFESFRTHYKQTVIGEQILDIEHDMSGFYKELTILKVLYIVQRSWNLVTPESICNSFRKCGLVAGSMENIYELTYFDNGAEENSSHEMAVECANSIEADIEIKNEVISPIPQTVDRNEAIKALCILKQYLGINHEGILKIEESLFNERKEYSNF